METYIVSLIAFDRALSQNKWRLVSEVSLYMKKQTIFFFRFCVLSFQKKSKLDQRVKKPPMTLTKLSTTTSPYLCQASSSQQGRQEVNLSPRLSTHCLYSCHFDI